MAFPRSLVLLLSLFICVTAETDGAGDGLGSSSGNVLEPECYEPGGTRVAFLVVDGYTCKCSDGYVGLSCDREPPIYDAVVVVADVESQDSLQTSTENFVKELQDYSVSECKLDSIQSSDSSGVLTLKYQTACYTSDVTATVELLKDRTGFSLALSQSNLQLGEYFFMSGPIDEDETLPGTPASGSTDDDDDDDDGDHSVRHALAFVLVLLSVAGLGTVGYMLHTQRTKDVYIPLMEMDSIDMPVSPTMRHQQEVEL